MLINIYIEETRENLDGLCGGVLSSKSMKIIGAIGMDVYFSEHSDTVK